MHSQNRGEDDLMWYFLFAQFGGVLVLFDLSASLSVYSICISGSSFLATAQPSMDYLGSAGTTEQGKQDRIGY